jgi:class 3 adenylate cyclase
MPYHRHVRGVRALFVSSPFRSLYVKILIIPMLAFGAGALVPGFLGYRLLLGNALRETREKALAMLNVLDSAQPGAAGKPEAGNSGSARSAAHARLAVLDSPDPAERADAFEERLIAAFEADHNMRRTEEEIERPEGRYLVMALPVAASRIGRAAQPGGKKGRVVGAAVAYVPCEATREQAALLFWTIFKIVGALSLLCAGLLVWRTRVVVVHPALRMLETSRAIRRGDWGAKFDARLPDEMATLALSFQDTTFWLRERVAQEEKLRALFQQFIPASVAARALGHDADKILAGTRHSVTVMIINIRNFKLLMEHLPPEQTVTTLNEFFSQVNRVIVANKGVVSKYLGDTVMAFFGMPLDNENHALNAVRAALEVPRALHDMYVRLDENYGWELGVGIGISTGEPIVGHFGSSEHMEYTVLGEVVGEAHRLEEITKSVPEEDTILVSEAAYRSLMSEVHVFDMGERATADGTKLHAYAVQGLRSEARSVLAA